MAMNKKHLGFTLIELVAGTIIAALCILTLNKLVGLNLQARKNIDYTITHRENEYISQILFDDIKSSSLMHCVGATVLNIYSTDAIINYKIDDGYFYRNDEILCDCKTGYLDVSNDIAFVMVKSDNVDLKLKLAGG